MEAKGSFLLMCLGEGHRRRHLDFREKAFQKEGGRLGPILLHPG